MTDGERAACGLFVRQRHNSSRCQNCGIGRAAHRKRKADDAGERAIALLRELEVPRPEHYGDDSPNRDDIRLRCFDCNEWCYPGDDPAMHCTCCAIREFCESLSEHS